MMMMMKKCDKSDITKMLLFSHIKVSCKDNNHLQVSRVVSVIYLYNGISKIK